MGRPERVHLRGESVLGEVPQGCEDGTVARRGDDWPAAPRRVSPSEERAQEADAKEVHVAGRRARQDLFTRVLRDFSKRYRASSCSGSIAPASVPCVMKTFARTCAIASLAGVPVQIRR